MFWLAIFLGLLAAGVVVSFLLASKREWVGFIAVPLTASLVITIYVLVFDRDAQAPVFLFMFYVVAGVAGAIGSLLGRAFGRRHLL